MLVRHIRGETGMIRTVFALAMGAALAGFMVNANWIGKATLTGRYGRNK